VSKPVKVEAIVSSLSHST